MAESTIGNIWSCIVSGDSISKGVVLDDAGGGYSILEDNYVSLVQRRTGGLIRNVSRFGSTLLKGKGRLAREIAEQRPDIVLIEYGGNECDFDWLDIAAHPETDHSPKTDLGEFEATLRETVQGLETEGIVPVLMTLPPLDADRFLTWVSRSDPAAEGRILRWLGSVTKIYWWQERYSALIAKVARTTGTRSIDVRGAFLGCSDFRDLICQDGIHPNAAGHRLIAQTILDYMAGESPALRTSMA